MNLDAISIFIKVVQCGSFTQAAKFLKMPVSTVSAKVASLERKLGVTLLQRTTRKIQITEAGETYFRGCAQALEEIQSAEAQILLNQKEPHGTLRITAPADIGNNLLPRIVAKFLNLYQNMDIEIIITNRIVDLIEEGVDLAIRAGDLKDSSLISKKFLDEPLSLWGSPDYLEKIGNPQHPHEIKDCEFFLYSFAKEREIKLFKGKEMVKISPKCNILLDSTEIAKKLAILGQGIGLLHNFACKDDVQEGKLIRILPDWHWHILPYYFIYPPQRFVSSKVRAFITTAENYLKDL